MYGLWLVWCGCGVMEKSAVPASNIMGPGQAASNPVSIKRGKVGCNNRWCHYQMQKSFCVRSQILLRGHGAIMQNQTCKRCLMMF